MTLIELKDAPKDLISSVRFAPASPILLTTSWDAQLRIYDARRDHGTLHSHITYKAPLLDACWDRTGGNSTAYVAGFERRVYAVDIEQGKTTPIGRDHNRAIKAVVHHIEYFNLPGTPQHEKYAFKCHRIVDKSPNAVDTVTPVNAIAFHPTYGTFFSGGSDAVVCLWDFQARKRMKQYPRFPASVLALDVDSTGTMLAVGVSDDAYKENPIELGPAPKASAVFVRYLAAEEARGKA
ncbi:hypothetical protein D0Z00_001985 [Geotrichum galactomycetum]|uniref:Uncharacterized protein n=1 Tax=Geotrichum galactomycetum TaxID=27317 RepID=A0ACB6V5I8_9ASCO|nr:hypothetical protein D0Z00_001985 [Geotrichum candidum]